MRALPLRLLPGDDLRRALDAALARDGGRAAFVLSGIGCIVRTTAEVLLAVLDERPFERAPDAATGYDELAIRRVPPAS